MKFSAPLALFILLLSMVGCTRDEPLTVNADSVTGTWKVTETVSTFYTDSIEMDHQVQAGKPNENYEFGEDGYFTLRQGNSGFSIHGNWQFNNQDDLLTLRPTNGDAACWQVKQLSANQMVICYENVVFLNGHQQQIKVTTTCTR